MIAIRTREPRRPPNGETDIPVTVTVDAPTYHNVGVLLRGTTLWRATNPPTGTTHDYLAHFQGGQLSGTATAR